MCRSVVQFHYGEDGIDVLSASFLKQFGFLSRNADRLQQQQLPGAAEAEASQAASLTSLEKEAAKASRQVDCILQHYLLFPSGDLEYLIPSAKSRYLQ